MLLLDGQNSHATLMLLDYAAERHILVIGYPPHCTDLLQGLDVAVFGALKSHWKKLRSDYAREKQRAITKPDFMNLYAEAAKLTFTTDIIHSAFRTTGVYPFNRHAIELSRLETVAESSITGSFALPDITPVKNIMNNVRLTTQLNEYFDIYT